MIDNAVYSKSDADIIFLGLPFYETCGVKGNGPSVIRRAVNSFSSFNEVSGVDSFDKLRVCDAGDIKAVNYTDLKSKVFSFLKGINGLPFIIGGEHLVSLPVIEFLKPKNVLFFDAHADFYNEYNGLKYSYATVIKRVSEFVDNVVIAGVRDLTMIESGLLKKADNVSLVSVNEIPKFNGSLYVSLDLDVLDPIYCPSVSTPIPLGVSLPHLVKVLNKVYLSNNVIGLDIVELTSKVKDLSSVNAGGIIMNYLKRRCD